MFHSSCRHYVKTTVTVKVRAYAYYILSFVKILTYYSKNKIRVWYVWTSDILLSGGVLLGRLRERSLGVKRGKTSSNLDETASWSCPLTAFMLQYLCSPGKHIVFSEKCCRVVMQLKRSVRLRQCSVFAS